MRRSFLIAVLSFLGLVSQRRRAAHAQRDAPPVGAAAPDLLDHAGGALARLITVARERAIADGVRPVPAAVQRGLAGYFPDDLLRRVRHGTGRAEAIALPFLAFTYGHSAAMTLGDVILFRDGARAGYDLKLWAHELTHVLQYQRWGIEGFAARYVRDSAAVEREAYQNADRFAAWRGTGG